MSRTDIVLTSKTRACPNELRTPQTGGPPLLGALIAILLHRYKGISSKIGEQFLEVICSGAGPAPHLLQQEHREQA